jgi:hypothetical protein
VELRLSAERGWIVEPQPASHGVEKWVAHHRGQGHHSHRSRFLLAGAVLQRPGGLLGKL